MRPIHPVLSLRLGVACGNTACGSSTAQQDSASSANDVLSPSMHLAVDGVSMTLTQPRDLVSSLLPPELELADTGNAGDTYPLVVLFDN
jgi:hypothetical protein